MIDDISGVLRIGSEDGLRSCSEWRTPVSLVVRTRLRELPALGPAPSGCRRKAQSQRWTSWDAMRPNSAKITSMSHHVWVLWVGCRCPAAWGLRASAWPTFSTLGCRSAETAQGELLDAFRIFNGFCDRYACRCSSVASRDKGSSIMSDYPKSLDRRDFLIASIATAGASAALAVNADAASAQDRRHPLPTRHRLRRRERSTPAM